MNTESPKSAFTARMSRKEKEFDALLRRAARLQARMRAARRRRKTAKKVA
jgi:hypothetical protein